MVRPLKVKRKKIAPGLSALRNWLIIIDTDLKVRMQKDVNGFFWSDFFVVNDGIIMTVSSISNNKDVAELRFYSPFIGDPLVIDKFSSITFAVQKGEDIIYHARGSKNKFLAFNHKPAEPEPTNKKSEICGQRSAKQMFVKNYRR